MTWWPSTSRHAPRAHQAADLLTDFVGRPRIDGDELNRERGVVVQEIARANDQPAVMAEHLIDEAAFGDHPLGRPVLGPAEHIRDTFTRDGHHRVPQPPLGARARRRVRSSATSRDCPSTARSRSCSRASEPVAEPAPYEPAPPHQPRVLVHERDSNQSHLRMSYRPWIESGDPEQRAALTIYSTLLGGSMGSRLFDEIREQRGLAYSVSRPARVRRCAGTPAGAGLGVEQVLEAYRRMRDIVSELRTDGPTEAEVERARAYAAGARAIAFENTGAIARHAAQQTIVYGEDVDPDETIALLDEVTFDEVREVAERVADELSIACVGPHTVEELESA